MSAPDFLLYGANGYVGSAAARMAVQQGLRPLLAGRNAAGVERIAAELGLDFRAFSLDDAPRLDEALRAARVVLHCAGPFIHTSRAVADACLRTGAHYLDITGEISVFAALASRDAEARARNVMLLPGVGFDVVPSDCLAVRLKQRLPSATRLELAFRSVGAGGMPPGTQRTAIEHLSGGIQMRRDGRIVPARPRVKTRQVDFGNGPVLVTRIPWGDLFTAYHSTGIPNIDTYTVLPPVARWLMALQPIFKPLLERQVVRGMLRRLVRPGPNPAQRARTVTHVWGEVQDEQGRRAEARLHGPEAGVEWTVRAALSAVRRVLSGDAPPGFQTPALAYGPDFMFESEAVTVEDLEA